MKAILQLHKLSLAASLIFALLAVMHLSLPLAAQPEPFGLPGETVTAVALFPSELAPWDNYLVAGTDSDGVFIRNLISPDSNWVNFGLLGKKITALHVYHWGVGPAEINSIFAGIRPDNAPDSTLIYQRIKYPTWWDSTWFAADSGLHAHSINQINAMSGFFSMGHSPPRPIFAAGNLEIFRATDFPTELEWDSVWSGGIGVINAIYIHREDITGSSGTVWAGGETATFAPLILKSVDDGVNWSAFHPNLGGDNACNSIAVDPLHPDTVYAGMEGAVIKTVDGGPNWFITPLHNTPYYFHGLVISPGNPDHLVAGGSTNSFQFGLFETFDGGNSWTAVLETDSIAGISSMDAQIEGNEFVVYMGTFGDGVYRYKSPVTGIKDRATVAGDFRLLQNYPNPFNPTTVISWQLAVGSEVELAIYNLLGQKIRTLVNGKQPAGFHRVEWDGRDDAGRAVASGIYVYQIKAGEIVQSRKMILIR